MDHCPGQFSSKRFENPVSTAKIYLYCSTKIAKPRPHRVECPTDSSVQKQWSMHVEGLGTI